MKVMTTPSAIQKNGGDSRAPEQILKIAIDVVELGNFALQLAVDGLKFLVGRLELFFGCLQLFEGCLRMLLRSPQLAFEMPDGFFAGIAFRRSRLRLRVSGAG
ncbi:MAG: hypothetical protein ACRD45_00265 [Bryobacteraceae bacterium]